MTEARYRLPNEIATQLQISPSTLRRWSKEFAPFLSDTAGRPHDEDEGTFSHRRYTDEDLETLMTVKGLLTEGLTYPQVTRRLEALRLRKTGADMLVDDDLFEDDDPITIVATSSRDPAYTPAVTVLADTLHTVADGQQLLLGSQQANRELLTVVLQDNFNLKQENTKLRDRMLELERDLISTRRREHSQRRNLEARLQRVEEKIRTQESEAEPNSRRGCLGRILRL